MKHRFSRATTAALCTTMLTVGTISATATGAPIDAKRAEAERLQQQINENGMKISSLGEQYNGAQLALDEARARVADAETRLTTARRRTLRIERLLKRRAVALYRSSSQATPLDAINASGLAELASRSKYAAAAAEHDAALIEQFQRSRDALRVQRLQFRRQQDQAQAQRDAAALARASIESANALQQQLLGKVKGDIATLMAAEQKRRDDDARRSALARVQPRPAPRGVDPGPVGGNFPDIPTSGNIAAVIAYARAQIGKPYVFATAGPETFDCSGLTMMAWRQAGVSMNHFSGSQFNQFPHVSISQLQPGDLVFKGPGGVDHVALYIGGGMQIAATHTGSFVKLQPLGSPLSGAVRPG